MRTRNRKSTGSRHCGTSDACDASGTDEGSTSDEEAPLVSFKAPEGISFYDALPPDIEQDFSGAFGRKIAHTFTTGWEIGVLN